MAIYLAESNISTDSKEVLSVEPKSERLTVEEEQNLLRQVAQRLQILNEKSNKSERTFEENRIVGIGERALSKLHEAHIGLIRSQVRFYRNKGFNQKNVDLEHEATCAFFAEINRYEPSKGARLSTWVFYGIRHRLQTITGIEIRVEKARLEAQLKAPAYTPAEEVQDSYLAAQLRAAMTWLNDRQFTIVTMQLEGLSWVEIGLRLQSSAAAVMTCWRRATEKLENLIAKNVGPKPVKEPERTQSEPATTQTVEPDPELTSKEFWPRRTLAKIVRFTGQTVSSAIERAIVKPTQRVTTEAETRSLLPSAEILVSEDSKPSLVNQLLNRFWPERFSEQNRSDLSCASKTQPTSSGGPPLDPIPKLSPIPPRRMP
jgi:RNA polymerase sigma factor (sigma-70 family)